MPKKQENPVPPYLTISDAYVALIELPSIRAKVSSQDESFLETLLEMSAGIDSLGQKVYRIFWVAARFLSQISSQEVKEEASYLEGSVKYQSSVEQVIEELLNLQNAQDLAYKVPTGFEALPVAMDGGFASGMTHWTEESALELLNSIEFYRA